MSPKPFKCDKDTALRIETRLGFHLMHVNRIIFPPTPKYKLLGARFRKLKGTGYSLFTGPDSLRSPTKDQMDNFFLEMKAEGYSTEELSRNTTDYRVISFVDSEEIESGKRKHHL